MPDYRTSRINGTTSLNIIYIYAACLCFGGVLNCKNAYDGLLKWTVTACSLQSP